jgi:hypothetical protein
VRREKGVTESVEGKRMLFGGRLTIAFATHAVDVAGEMHHVIFYLTPPLAHRIKLKTKMDRSAQSSNACFSG